MTFFVPIETEKNRDIMFFDKPHYVFINHSSIGYGADSDSRRRGNDFYSSHEQIAIEERFSTKKFDLTDVVFAAEFGESFKHYD